ncbi:MAG: nucleoside hydrolase [Planctomycetes bacterium]|nr:nucleoside hydrolase [Planctomycetota bacterium]
MSARKIIIDTDIGDDIDDALALAFALGSPEFEILGVTTVFGNVVTRAKIARKLCRAWGREDIPIVVGAERPMGYWYHWGRDPVGDNSQAPAVANEPDLPDHPRRYASQFIIDTVRKYPGEVTVVTLGALTNIGMALCTDPGLAEIIQEVVTLGGLQYLDRVDIAQVPGWNIPYDTIAGQCVARSNVAWRTACGGPNPTKDFLNALAASDREADAVLSELIVLKANRKDGMDVSSVTDLERVSACDVYALASMLIPEAYDYRQGRWVVDAQGFCVFHECADGAHLRPGKNVSPDYLDMIGQRMLGTFESVASEV